MSAETSAVGSTSVVLADSAINSGLTLSLHPLPILNISEHHTRSTLQDKANTKIIGALLGTQNGREISIVNTFELIIRKNDQDIAMDSEEGRGEGGGAEYKIDKPFLEMRQQQFKQVFPTLDLMGWYTVGPAPTSTDVSLHSQFFDSIETPLLIVLSPPTPTNPLSSSDLPLKIYESALADSAGPSTSASGTNTGKFIELGYVIETTDAERIAVDGAAKAEDAEGGDAGSGLIASLTTQRNAIKMLYDRMLVLLQYIDEVIAKTAKPDHAVLREIAAVVAGLPAMQGLEFKDEFATEATDIQLTGYMASLTKAVAVLSDLTDKFNVTIQKDEETVNASAGGAGGGRFRHGPGPRNRMGKGGAGF